MLPPDYEGSVPDGYFVVPSRTYRVWVFMRGSIAEGLEKAVQNIKDNLRVYPLSQKDNPLPMEFINGSGKFFNTQKSGLANRQSALFVFITMLLLHRHLKCRRNPKQNHPFSPAKRAICSVQ